MNRWLLTGALLALGCSAGRSVNKTAVATDSVRVLKTDVVSKMSGIELTEVRSVAKSQGSVFTRPDSAKSSFFFNPSDTGLIEAAVETGSLKVKALFNPKSGRGVLVAEKKPEEVMVDVYKEESVKTLSSKVDSNSRRFLDSMSAKKEEHGKVTYSDRGMFLCYGLLLLLCCLLALLYWIRKRLKL